MITKLDQSGKYYSYNSIYGYYPQGARIFIAVGEGGVGKTTDALRKVANWWRRNKDWKFVICRDMGTATDTFNSKDGQFTLEQHFGAGISIKGDEIWLKDKHIGRLMALSTFYLNKGLELHKQGYRFIFFDEFIPEVKQRITLDQCRAFYRTLQTTLRTDKDARILMAGNNVRDTPLWGLLGVYPSEEGKIYRSKNGLVILEYCLPTEEWIKEHEQSVAGRLGVGDDKATQIQFNTLPIGITAARNAGDFILTNGVQRVVVTSACPEKFVKRGKLGAPIYTFIIRYNPEKDKELPVRSTKPITRGLLLRPKDITNYKRMLSYWYFDSRITAHEILSILG